MSIQHYILKFVFCKKLFPRNEEEKESKSKSDQTSQKNPNEGNNKGGNDILVAYSLLLQAVESFEKDGKAANSSIVKATMLKLEPAFKEATYGFKQFSQFLLRAAQDKIITLEQQRKNTYLIKKYKSS